MRHVRFTFRPISCTHFPYSAWTLDTNADGISGPRSWGHHGQHRRRSHRGGTARAGRRGTAAPGRHRAPRDRRPDVVLEDDAAGHAAAVELDGHEHRRVRRPAVPRELPERSPVATCTSRSPSTSSSTTAPGCSGRCSPRSTAAGSQVVHRAGRRLRAPPRGRLGPARPTGRGRGRHRRLRAPARGRAGPPRRPGEPHLAAPGPVALPRQVRARRWAGAERAGVRGAPARGRRGRRGRGSAEGDHLAARRQVPPEAGSLRPLVLRARPTWARWASPASWRRRTSSGGSRASSRTRWPTVRSGRLRRPGSDRVSAPVPITTGRYVAALSPTADGVLVGAGRRDPAGRSTTSCSAPATGSTYVGTRSSGTT